MGGADPRERRRRRITGASMASKSKLLSGTSGGTAGQPFVLKDPLVVMFQQDGQLVCHIHPAKGIDHRHYGLVVCDLVRHVARAFQVEEADVWEWVDKERRRPTTGITRPS
jgi:hypothetical protein